MASAPRRSKPARRRWRVRAPAAAAAIAACSTGCVLFDWTYAPGGTGGGGATSSSSSMQCPASCDDSDPCTIDACADGPCTHSDAPAGTACDTGKVCDGHDKCVEGGAYVWAENFTDASAGNIGLGPSGNIYAFGFLGGDAMIGSIGLHPTSGASSGFVAKLGADGKPLAAKIIGDAPFQQLFPSGLSVGAGDAVTLTGSYAEGADFLGCAAPAPGTGTPGFVLSASEDLACKWLVTMSTKGGTEAPQMSTVAAHPDGGVVTVGIFTDALTVSTPSGPHMVSASGSAFFLARFDAQGTLDSLHTYGGASLGPRRQGLSVAVAPSGELFISAEFTGTLEFDDGTALTASSAGTAVCVAKLDSGGKRIWSNLLTGTDGAALSGSYGVLALDGTAHVAVVGTSSGGVDFGGGVKKGPGAFAASFAQDDGALVYARALPSEDANMTALSLYAAAFNPLGNLAVTGQLGGTLALETGTLTGAGPGIFTGKLDSKGQVSWAKVFGDDKNHSEGFGIFCDTQANTYFAGFLKGSADFGGGALSDPSGNQGTFVAKLGP